MWSPPSWYTPEELVKTAKSWRGKDFHDVVLHSHQSRWGHAELDPKYAKHQAKYQSTLILDIPALLLHGEQDRCELPETTDGAERYFSARTGVFCWKGWVICHNGKIRKEQLVSWWST